MRWLLIPTVFTSLACAGRQTPSPGLAQAADDPLHPRGITFIENDLSGARTQAQAQGKPLFVDAWAPW